MKVQHKLYSCQPGLCRQSQTWHSNAKADDDDAILTCTRKLVVKIHALPPRVTT